MNFYKGIILIVFMKKKASMLVQLVLGSLFFWGAGCSSQKKHFGLEHEFNIINSGDSEEIRKVCGLEESETYQRFMGKDGVVYDIEVVRGDGVERFRYMNGPEGGRIERKTSYFVPNQLTVYGVFPASKE